MSAYRFKHKTQAQKEKSAREYDDYLDEESQRTDSLIAEAAVQLRLEKMKPHKGLKRLRSELGLTQDQMAVQCKVSKRTYQFYETGQKAIPSTVLARLAARYQFNIHTLFFGRVHSDSIEVRPETAKFIAEIVDFLTSTFSSMSMEEKQHVAMHFASNNRHGTKVDVTNLFESIIIVTGEKYLGNELGNAGELDISYDDLDWDDT